jgi:mannan endo-1,4-beta-mannosidase
MFKSKTILLPLLTIISLNIFFSCKKDELPMPNNSSQKYTTLGSKVLLNTKPIQLIGANAFHVFSAGSTDMNSWNIDISREFIGNIKETQLQGNPIKDSNGASLYSLQSIIDGNRINNRVTILCAFGWDGKNETEFTGKSPTKTAWWNDYKIKLKEWATYFKDQPDVWIEVWNEPYRYDRADGYTDIIWMNDMNEMVEIIRNTGNQNIILVPCAEQGQDESTLINKGTEFLANKSNIIYDIHAYEKWLLDSGSSIDNRLQQLKLKNIPILFGETAPFNAGTLMNPQSFLEIIYNRGLSVCAWVWKKDENDKDGLLTSAGIPNDNNNNNWGTTYKNFAAKVRNP